MKIGWVLSSFYDGPSLTYKRKVYSMSYVYFVTPIYTPVFYPPTAQPPVVYYPTKTVTYKFPIPMLYSTPPPAIL